MANIIIENKNLDAYDLYNNLHCFYLKDRNDLGIFISDSYQGRLDLVNRIPIKEWFIYYIDDSGDIIADQFILVEDCIKSLEQQITYSVNLLEKLKELKNDNYIKA